MPSPKNNLRKELSETLSYALEHEDYLLAHFVSTFLADGVFDFHGVEIPLDELTKEQADCLIEEYIENMTSWDAVKPIYRAIERSYLV